MSTMVTFPHKHEQKHKHVCVPGGLTHTTLASLSGHFLTHKSRSSVSNPAYQQMNGATSSSGKVCRIDHVPRHIARATIEHLQASKTVYTASGCWEAQTGLSGTSLYPQVQPKYVNREQRSRGRAGAKYKPYKGENGRLGRVLVHQLSCLAHTGQTPGPTQDVSHLCHNRKCFNPDHLVIEEHSENMSEQHCPGTLKGPLLCKCCGNTHDHEIVVCQHVPKCLTITGIGN